MKARPRRTWWGERWGAGCVLALCLAGCHTEPTALRTAAEVRGSTSAATFDLAAPAELEVRSPLLVRPRINGREVGWFFVDTGATGMVISPAAARAAGMEEGGRVHVVGASKFDATGWHCRVFELGPL